MLGEDLGENVELRLAHSAERQPCGNSIYHAALLCATISAQDLPIAQAHRRNSGSHCWHRVFEMYARLSHDLFLSLRGKLKEGSG
jgi:hypothetical protein